MFRAGLMQRLLATLILGLIPEFLHIYGSQIHTVYRSKEVSVDNDVVPEEVAFYQTALPDPVANVPGGKLPALERLQILTVRSSF
jgi:hypothetical protein